MKVELYGGNEDLSNKMEIKRSLKRGNETLTEQPTPSILLNESFTDKNLKSLVMNIDFLAAQYQI